jgi:hypothetical protein
MWQQVQTPKNLFFPLKFNFLLKNLNYRLIFLRSWSSYKKNQEKSVFVITLTSKFKNRIFKKVIISGTNAAKKANFSV